MKLYLVQFTPAKKTGLSRRWRKVKATDPGLALQRALRIRAKRKCLDAGTLWGWVAEADGPRHETGMPVLVHGYECAIAPHATTITEQAVA